MLLEPVGVHCSIFFSESILHWNPSILHMTNVEEYFQLFGWQWLCLLQSTIDCSSSSAWSRSENHYQWAVSDQEVQHLPLKIPTTPQLETGIAWAQGNNSTLSFTEYNKPPANSLSQLYKLFPSTVSLYNAHISTFDHEYFRGYGQWASLARLVLRIWKISCHIAIEFDPGTLNLWQPLALSRQIRSSILVTFLRSVNCRPCDDIFTCQYYLTLSHIIYKYK